MPRTEVGNTGYTTRVTKAPAVCQNCGHAVSKAPAWMSVLEALAPGRGQPEPAYTLTAIAGRIEGSRQRTLQMLNDAVSAGVLERDRSSGAPLYRRTRYGQKLLARWKSVGWRG